MGVRASRRAKVVLPSALKSAIRPRVNPEPRAGSEQIPHENGGQASETEIESVSVSTGVSSGFHGVARGGLANLAGMAISGLASLVLVVIVARTLSPSDAGAVFALTSLFLLAATGTRLGADVSIVHFLAGARGAGRPHDATGLLRTALIPVAAAGAAVGVVLMIAAPAVLDVVLREASFPHAQAAVVVLAVAVPVVATYDVVIAATRGLGAVRPTVLVDRLLRPLLQVVFVLAVVSTGGGPFAVVCAWVAPYAVVAVPACLSLVHLLPPPTRGAARMPALDVAGFWRFTLPRSFTGVLQIALQRLDILLVGAMAGVTAAAVYTAATRFLVVGQLANQAIWYPVQPRLAMLVSARDLEKARRLYRLSTAWLIGLTWPLFLACLVAAPVMMRLFGDGYESGDSTVVILAAAMLLSAACGLVEIVLITLGRTSWNLWNTLVAFVVNIGVDLVLIPRIGISGAAIGWALSIAVRNLMALVQVGRHSGFYPLDRSGLTIAAHAFVCFAAVPAIVVVFYGESRVAVGTALVVGAAAYLVGLWPMRRRLHLDFGVRRERGDVFA
jgi:O-antigen/teichoic acid export membrane protein